MQKGLLQKCGNPFFVLSEYGMIGLVAEDVLAELDEGLSGA